MLNSAQDDLKQPLTVNSPHSTRSVDHMGDYSENNAKWKRAAVIFLVTTIVCLAVIGYLAVEIVKRDKDNEHNKPEPAVNPAWKAVAENVSSNLDRSVDPCNDFYTYACGGWIKSAKIPSDDATNNNSFKPIGAKNVETLKDILENENPQLIGDYYKSCMDEDAIEKVGLTAIHEYRQMLTDASSLSDLILVAGSFTRYGIQAFFSTGILADAKDPKTHVFAVGQGGLALPNRDYYLSDSFVQKFKQPYIQHLTNMFKIVGYTDERAQTAANNVYDIEYKIANITVPVAELRDPIESYNVFTIEKLNQLAPVFQWGKYLDNTYYNMTGAKIVVDAPAFFSEMQKLLPTFEADLENTLKPYVLWNLIRTHAQGLNKDMRNEYFNFFGKAVQGQSAMEPRWKYCVSKVDTLFGDLLSQKFVEKVFNDDTEKKAQYLVDGIEKAFRTNLPNVDWMDDTTRRASIEKLNQVINLIGRPDSWDSFEGFKLSDSFFRSSVNSLMRSNFNTAQKLQKPVDRYEWQMTPPTVNAYYDPSLNEMVFPAGILQPPFYNLDFPDAMNYGGIGMVMGHELTHGFDDQGAQYDGTGTLRSWWPKEIVDKFNERATCLQKQYDSYTVSDDKGTVLGHVNGLLTLGENIADNGGIRLGFGAFQKHVNDHGEEPQLVDFLTNEQLYFVAFAQNWCTVRTDEFTLARLKTDPHSPSEHRVNGPLRNYDQFAKAFKCDAGTHMNPKDKCILW
eukprot:GFYU01000694.1.p1 GENE.GFYU01000694.1~~GFYU01000694.1.p1  ORF type:complete len:734 (-),score=261.49 GFYU01000694.1:776-2977(-)